MKRNMFLRIFLLVFIAVAIVFTSGILAVRQNSRKILTERLTVEAELLSVMIKDENDIAQLKNYKNKDDFRITVIGHEGKVLYESSITGELENHADREEVKSALEGKPHSVERYSETFNCVMSYYAISSVLNNGDPIIIRVAVKDSEITEYLNVTIPLSVLVLIIALVISAIAARQLSSSLSSKVTAVADSLKSLNDGEYKPIKTNSKESEFYAIFRQINELNEKTHRHIISEEAEHKKLEAVLDNISQGIIAIDEQKNIVFANGVALNIFGGDKKNIGKNLIYLTEDINVFQKTEEMKNNISAFEYRYNERDYSIILSKIPSETSETGIHTIIIITDVTKEKNIAKEKSEFFANASHELKTPITVMQGLSELILAKNNIDDGTKKQIDRIHKESMRLSSLISDMLKLSSLERKEEKVADVKINLRNVADEVISELSLAISEKRLSVSVSGQGFVIIDPEKIYGLVGNLCSNSVKYNKDNGSLDITIEENDGKVIFKVKDTGIGIGKEHLPRICERFYRVDKSRSKKTGGTGLGLAIVKHICSLYDAKLAIESTENEGTEVTVTFNGIKD